MKKLLHKVIGLMIKILAKWYSKTTDSKTKPSVSNYIIYIDANGKLMYQDRTKVLDLIGVDKEKYIEPFFIGYPVKQEEE